MENQKKYADIIKEVETSTMETLSPAQMKEIADMQNEMFKGIFKSK